MKSLILLVGKSGSGKNYITDAFNLKPVVSYTTRPIRINETDGVEHWFVGLNHWNRLADSELFHTIVAAWTKFNSNYYWTTYEDLNNEENDVYIVDPKGVEDVKNAIAEGLIRRGIKIIYLKTSEETRRNRMNIRGDSEEQIENRIRNDNIMFQNVIYNIALNVND